MINAVFELTLHLSLRVCELRASAALLRDTRQATAWTWSGGRKSIRLRGDSASPSVVLPFHFCQMQQFQRQQLAFVDFLLQL